MSRAARLKSAADLSFGQILTPRLPVRFRRGCEKPNPKAHPMKTDHDGVAAAADIPAATGVVSTSTITRRKMLSIAPETSVLFVHIQHLVALRSEFCEVMRRYDVAGARFDDAFGDIPDVLRVTARDRALFHGELPRHGFYFTGGVDAILRDKMNGYQRCYGAHSGVEWRVDETARQRGDEILAALKARDAREKRLFKATGCRAIQDRIDTLRRDLARVVDMIADYPASTLEDLVAKAAVISGPVEGDDTDMDLIRESIVRDLHAIAPSAMPPAAARAPEALVA